MVGITIMKNDLTGLEMIQSVYDRWVADLEVAAQARRCAVLDGITTAKQLCAWGSGLRAWLRQVVGPLPPADTTLRQTGLIERDGYHIEKWLFPSLPGTWTGAHLYVPEQVNPKGFALCAPVGHWSEGKAMKDYQQMAGFMALHGIPVLVYDHAGIGERREYLNRVTGLSLPGKSPTDEHCHTGALATLAGIPAARFYIAEAVRAFHFLASFPFVNRDHIGFTGASGGGTISYLAGAYLEQTACVIPVCIVRGEEAGGTADAEQQRPANGIRGVAAVDYLTALAPKPVMVVTEAGFEKSERSFSTLRRFYGIAGAPDAAGYFAVEDVHGYTHPMVEAVHAFLARNFDLPATHSGAWSRIRMLSTEETWCGLTGCLMRDRSQVTLQEQIAHFAPKPTGLSRDRLADLLGIRDWVRAPVPYLFTGKAGAKIRLTGAVTARPDELGLVAWEERPAEYWHGQGWLYQNHDAGEARRLPGYGRSLIGLRVRQILDFLEDHKDAGPTLYAEREWSVPLALACAIAPAALLSCATVRYLPACFRNHLYSVLNTTPLSVIVPGLLAAGDMDDVLTLCEGRLIVEHRVDADGRVIS